MQDIRDMEIGRVEWFDVREIFYSVGSSSNRFGKVGFALRYRYFLNVFREMYLLLVDFFEFDCHLIDDTIEAGKTAVRWFVVWTMMATEPWKMSKLCEICGNVENSFFCLKLPENNSKCRKNGWNVERIVEN